MSVADARGGSLDIPQANRGSPAGGAPIGRDLIPNSPPASGRRPDACADENDESYWPNDEAIGHSVRNEASSLDVVCGQARQGSVPFTLSAAVGRLHSRRARITSSSRRRISKALAKLPHEHAHRPVKPTTATSVPASSKTHRSSAKAQPHTQRAPPKRQL